MQFPHFSNFSKSNVAVMCHGAVQREHNKDQRQNSAPLVPWPLHHYLSNPEGVAYKDRGYPKQGGGCVGGVLA